MLNTNTSSVPHFHCIILFQNIIMNYARVFYPHLRRETNGPYGEERFSLVDMRNGEVVASWVEREVHIRLEEDCRYIVAEMKVDQFRVYVRKELI